MKQRKHRTANVSNHVSTVWSFRYAVQTDERTRVPVTLSYTAVPHSDASNCSMKDLATIRVTESSARATKCANWIGIGSRRVPVRATAPPWCRTYAVVMDRRIATTVY
ncbi:hypothetical protein DPMN_022447 [Dreissena polymorpha]|uniref:Uncharacterized protein n=1 Tax=Dreissena polymorpha TaxID=45954 RepID=A0A9D4NPE8_DREPO|nr:hypothetical protein DPMN_022447 [Dreissena polymorpha]